MSTELKRVTISVTPDMAADLDVAREEYNYKGTRNDMMKDLIVRGLASLTEENKQTNQSSQ